MSAAHGLALGWESGVGNGKGGAAAAVERAALIQLLRPSCEALLARHAAAAASAAAQRDEARAALSAARRAVQTQERALLRGEQLSDLLRAADRRAAQIAETLDDDDLATAAIWRA
jgi:hypothetical protein